MKSYTYLAGLIILFAAGPALAQSGETVTVSDARLEFGKPLLGAPIEAASVKNPGPNCYKTDSYMDCEYQDDRGVNILVYGNQITRKRARSDYLSRGRSLPFGVRPNDTSQDAQDKLNKASPLSFSYSQGRDLLISDGVFTNANGTNFTMSFRYSGNDSC